MSGISLLVNGSHGVYVPQVFAEQFDLTEWVVNVPDPMELESVDNQYYWETWEDVLNNASYTDKDGHVWTLYQDGDLWAVCYELLTDEEREAFGWNE